MLIVCLAMIEDENDRLNFERIYHKYEKDVFRRIYRFLKNREDTEDAMQNTWLVITKNIEFYRDLNDISIRAYILRIARNQAVSLYRKRRKEEDMVCDTDLTVIADDSEFFRICEYSEIAEIVKCIDQLDEIYSDVLNLYYLHHKEVKEIARLFGLNEHTVRSRIVRGKEKLIQLLKRRGFYE